MRLVFFGPPGAGKGTQAAMLSLRYGIAHISTGDMLRAIRGSDTPLGRRIRETIDRGDLLDDATMIEIIRERLAAADARGGFVLDGFPRTVAQAEALDLLLAETKRDLDFVLEISVSAEVLLGRILKRASETAASGRKPRDDDNEEVFASRMRAYRQQTAPLARFYERTHRLTRVDGDQPAHVVQSVLVDLLGPGRQIPANRINPFTTLAPDDLTRTAASLMDEG